MSRKKQDPYQEELFRLAQDLDDVEIREAEPLEPAEEPPPPVVNFDAPKVEHPEVPEDTFQKAYDELDAILKHFQKTMGWPAWQEPWWKQREKVLKSYGMTVDGFYDQLTKRSEAKKKAQTPE